MNPSFICGRERQNFRNLRHSTRLGVLAVLAALTCAVVSVRAAVTEAWVQRYNSVQAGGNDHVSKVVRDAAGDIIVAGGTDNHTTGHDLLTIKYAGTNGSVIWQRRYNGPGNKSDGASALAVDGKGNVVVAGFSSNGTNNDFYAAKYSGSDGTLIWENRHAGAANGNDSATAMVVDENGNVVVTGFSSSLEQDYRYYPATTNDFYTAKYAAANGALLWERRYNGPADGDDAPKAISVDADGDVVVTGYSVGADGASDYYTAKYAGTDGALLWERRSDSPPNRSDRAAALTVDLNGDVLVTGSSSQNIGGSTYYTSDYYTAKYAAADGALLWEQRYDGPGNSYDAASAVLADSLGNVIVTGASKGIGDVSGFYTAKYSGADGAILWDTWSTNGGSLLALDDSGNVVVAGFEHTGGTSVATFAAADGALLWERTLRNGQWDSPAAIAVSGNGEVVVTRNTQGSSHKDYHWFTTKMASDGQLLWQQKFDGPANGHDRAVGLAIDRSGNVAVTGTSITAKYAAADGALLWKKPRGEVIAMDDAGNVILAGQGWPRSQSDLWLIKYSPDGEVLWEQERSGAYNYPVAMTVDRSGNVVIIGWFYKAHRPSYGSDYFTAKYAANDGTLLWETSYNGPADSEDRASAVALDQEGNVIVTGGDVSAVAAGSGNYYTAKYAANDGTLLWERRYNGPANSGDSANAIAVDGSGNVIVTGSSSNGTNTDYATVKYAAANGTLLWERRFNGPANGDDEPAALAVDGNGDVVVTGSSSGPDRVTDCYTAKYAAASGAVLWEKRYHNAANSYGRGQKVVVDANGDAIVAADSGGSYYTAKYSTADGALLWEERLDIPPNRSANVAGLGVGPDGMVAVTGQYYTSFVDGVLPDYDYVTVVYRENRPPVIACPSNTEEIATSSSGAVVYYTIAATDDSGLAPAITCAPPSGSVFPIGQASVTCTATDGDGLSSTCVFTVTVRGARGVKQNVLAELIALRDTVTDRDDARQLDEAVAHLTQSLATEFWMDETHLERKHGGKVFHKERETAQKLCDLIQSRKSQLPDTVLQGFVDQLIQADRLLAVVAIEDARLAGVREQKIAQAEKFLARGDADAGDQRCGNGIEDYRQAWKRVARATMSPPVRLANGRVRMEIAGEPGERFFIQVSSNLRDWTTIGTRTASAEGVVTYEDPDAGRHATRFYRVVVE